MGSLACLSPSFLHGDSYVTTAQASTASEMRLWALHFAFQTELPQGGNNLRVPFWLSLLKNRALLKYHLHTNSLIESVQFNAFRIFTTITTWLCKYHHSLRPEHFHHSQKEAHTH